MIWNNSFNSILVSSNDRFNLIHFGNYLLAGFGYQVIAFFVMLNAVTFFQKLHSFVDCGWAAIKLLSKLIL